MHKKQSCLVPSFWLSLLSSSDSQSLCLLSLLSDSEALISLIQSSSLYLKMLIPLLLLSDRGSRFRKLGRVSKRLPWWVWQMSCFMYVSYEEALSDSLIL
jgi:hypothetical protein